MPEAGSDESRKKEKGRWRFVGPLTVALLWSFCFFWYIFTPAPELIERFYSRGLYRVIVRTVAATTGLVPFSLILTMLALAPATFLLLWVGNWVYRRRVHRLPHWRGLIWGPKWMLVIIPVLWLWFLMFWGFGYQRVPIEQRLDFDVATVSEDEVRQIESGLLAIINRDQPATAADRDVARAVAAVSLAMQEVVEAWEGRPIRIPRRVKATPPGLLLMNGTSGICVPFTLEPHVDGGLPDTSFVSVAAHELGHIAGVCDEGETNLLGYVAGLRADDPYARYAVALSIYRSMSRHNPEARTEALARLPEQAREDLRRASEASQRYRIDWFQKWSWRAYNQYLKSQGVREGVQSYGRGTKLLVYAWRDGHIELPVVADGIQHNDEQHEEQSEIQDGEHAAQP